MSLEFILRTFKVLPVTERNILESFRALDDTNVITNVKTLSSVMKRVVNDVYQPVHIETLLRKNGVSDLEACVKQFLHYVSSFYIGAPEFFFPFENGGTDNSVVALRGVTFDEISDLFRKIMYSNAPIKNVEEFANVVKNGIVYYDELSFPHHRYIDYDINKVKNNDLRVKLFNVDRDVFENGDDAVRWLSQQAGLPLLIRNKQSVDAFRIVGHRVFIKKFLQAHERALASVFNRNKKLIMALKNYNTSNEINRISRLSKSLHVPIVQSLSKTLISEALKREISMDEIKSIPVRDRLKILNAINVRFARLNKSVYNIRNGKVFIRDARHAGPYDLSLGKLELDIIKSLDLSHLEGKKILLPENIFYGLPISEKQTIGRLPYGTRVFSNNAADLSAGIFWEESGGARDLDLSSISISNERIGWGGDYNSKDGDVSYSGDITFPTGRGATEFITVKAGSYANLALYVNIFNGDISKSRAHVIVGSSSEKHWINDVVLKEEIELAGQTVIGFIHHDSFVLSREQIGNKRVSSYVEPDLIRRGSLYWNVNGLLNVRGIRYSTERDPGVEYDYDLSYENFTYDKLVSLLIP